MNVVGKIFFVTIFVISIVCMAIALMLQAAHIDWRNKVIAKGGLRDQLEAANKEKQQLSDEKNRLEVRIAEEKERYVKRLAALEQVKTELFKERDANARMISEKEDDLQKLSDAIASIHNSVKSLQEETMSMRNETKAAIDERRKIFEKVITINDDLLNAVTERLRLEKLGRELRAQLSKLLPTAIPVGVPNHNQE